MPRSVDSTGLVNLVLMICIEPRVYTPEDRVDKMKKGLEMVFKKLGDEL